MKPHIVKRREIKREMAKQFGIPLKQLVWLEGQLMIVVNRGERKLVPGVIRVSKPINTEPVYKHRKT
jgi:hypothetical protein